MLGEQGEGIPLQGESSGHGLEGGAGTAKQFFPSKQPQTKIEELAVAARFRELHHDAQVHEKRDFQAVFKTARRNFDSQNFSFDIANAKQAGLFTRGNEITLAHYGQNYVDALPDREAVKRLRKPKKTTRKRKAARKKKQ
jgi:hypothetical protein